MLPLPYTAMPQNFSASSLHLFWFKICVRTISTQINKNYWFQPILYFLEWHTHHAPLSVPNPTLPRCLLMFFTADDIDLHMFQDSTCCWALTYIVSAFFKHWVSSTRTLLIGCFLSPVSPFSFHCFIGATGACFLPSAWRLMAGLPGFASYGTSLYLAADC